MSERTALPVPAGELPDPDTVRAELARVLESKCFATSARLRSLLAWLVEQTLGGNAERLKEYTIALEVFGRGADFDPRIEGVVRNEAWRLRTRLAQYYRTDGADNPVRLELAPRSFAVSVARAAASVTGLALPGSPTSVPASPSAVRLAVLPFDVDEHSPEARRFADGLAEELGHALRKLPRIEIVGRSSCRRVQLGALDAREIGERLGARLLLEGSVRHDGARFRLMAELVDTQTGCQIWTHALERPWSDAITLPGVIADDLLAELMRSVDGWMTPLAESFVDSLCFDADLRQMLLFGMACPPHAGSILRRAVTWLEARVSREPANGAARAQLASVLALFVTIVPAASADLLPQVERHALAALSADPQQVDALVAWGMASLFVCDWMSARRALGRAIAVAPQHCSARIAHGLLQMQVGELDGALDDLRIAREANPLSVSVSGTLSAVLMNARRYGEAAEFARRAIALDEAFKPASVLLADAMLWDGRTACALSRFEELSRMDGRTVFGLGKLGFAYGRAGNIRKARELLDELKQRDEDPARVEMACAHIHLGLDEREAALDALSTVLATPTGVERLGPELMLRSAPQFDAVRGDPRFVQLLNRLGLVRS
ncbi:hypothetical protein [Paraburkholderia sp. J67]|uniref:hypothetical protein n=1 Tax=Paraburkholderia sp. J67 TaxID=2805435 RepID=UPI002ABE9FB5|nr:hypothetical protein [Paraburkholderia sp. J67]